MAGRSCVRVEPPFVRFNDVRVGEVYKTTVTVTNVGKNGQKILIKEPEMKVFKLTVTSPGEVVAPGLSVSGLLAFTPEEEEEVRDRLLIHIDAAETIRVPLLVFPRTCSLLMDSQLDFGCVAASSQVITRYHPITNQGSAPGVFQVQYSGDPSVRLSPSSGVVAAGATQQLEVELHTGSPGLIDDTALVKLQNQAAVLLRIRAEVVDQHLEVFDLQGTRLSCLWFGPLYFGTSHVETVVLKNNSPQACDWVCVLQERAAGTELGTDLLSSTAALLETTRRCSSADQDVSQVLVCVPKQGHLGPYDRTTVAVRFSPVCNSRSSNQKKRQHSSSRRLDYCLFLLFESVGSKHGFTHHDGDSSVELAVSGSGLPVSLVLSPSPRLDFPPCVSGQRVDLLCVLQNLCPQLPVNFRFRKVAHFTTEPSAGAIAPGQCQDVVLSFVARQQGSFQVRQELDVLGYVVRQKDDVEVEDGARLELGRFHGVSLQLSAVCCSDVTRPRPQLNPGITPAVTNPTGLQPRVRSSELAHCRRMASAAVLAADKTRLHTHRSSSSSRRRRRSPHTLGQEEFLAFPNDRAASIRPGSPHTLYRTIFTGVSRYSYVDPDYSLTEEEQQRRNQQRQLYSDYIQQLRHTRLNRTTNRQRDHLEEDVDLGTAPPRGLVPPTLRITDLQNPQSSDSGMDPGDVTTATKLTQQTASLTQQVCEVAAVPSSSQQVADCSRTLTPQQLYSVLIGPLLVDFGEVCVQSVCVEELQLTNGLSWFVWVQLELDCPELQGSSPLSHVLPPHSHHTLPLTFQSSTLGRFHRSVSYSVNQQHPGQVLVQAQVVPVALELSTSLLVLHPSPTLLAASGYRSSVTLRNRRNHPAEFTWRPVVTETGILFSVRPATGLVEPFKELDCEVVWHPSFSSPPEGDFDLCVAGGNTQRLHCIAKVGSTTVQLDQNQLLFGSVPLNMCSIRTAVLHNTGHNHAYYQVLDVSPLPGMVLSPSEGVVPSRGQTAVHVHFNPDAVIRFDTRVEIALRNMKSIQLRVRGSVEPPNVDFSVSDFQFHGVHAGSQRMIPFSVINNSAAAARVTFNLSQYTDFSLLLPEPSAEEAAGVSVVDVQASQTVGCSLVFSPTQAAGYDFTLPLTINGLTPPTHTTSSSCSSCSSSSCSCSSSSLSTGSRKHIIQTFPHPVTMATQPSLRVQATVLCAPLEMSPSSLQFHMEPFPHSDRDTSTKTVELTAAGSGSVCWRDDVRDAACSRDGVGDSLCWRDDVGGGVCWRFDSSTAMATSSEGAELCEVSPSSGTLRSGQFVSLSVSIRPEAVPTVARVTRLSLPLYVGPEGDEGPESYRELSIIIILKLPSITFIPPQILLSPTPLGTTATAPLTLLLSGYTSGTRISAEVDPVELDDGNKIQPINVTFPEGDSVPAPEQQRVKQAACVVSVMCSVTFCSTLPLSISSTLTFTDHLHNRFQVEVCAAADCCLLTAWPYLALHQSEHHVVLNTGATAVEAILQRRHTPRSTSGHTSSSSSSSSVFDRNSSTSRNSASDSFPDSESVSGQVSRDEDVSPTNHGVPRFPVDSVYHQSVLLAVERWFSFFGWPSGPHPVAVPHTLRRCESRSQMNPGGGRTYRVSQSKDSRCVVDMLHHLSGRHIPGIPRCQTFSRDVQRRTEQLLQQHGAMLAFLRVQGACLSHIRPEYLLDLQEFTYWSRQQWQQNQDQAGLDLRCVDYESLSKRSWTDVLLQTYKVLVLSHVSENQSLKAVVDRVDGILSSQLQASNIYSAPELQLLSWINSLFHSLRTRVWAAVGVPSARWVVNFDLDLTDGLVLAALIAAYCPYLICSHFQRMFTTASSLEQILHNNIIVVQALNTLHLNIDLQPTDLSDPNPVQMLMLCVHLYERLPQYLPTHTISLSGELHSTFSKQVRLKSPSSQPIRYQVLVLGDEAHLFSLPDGSTVTVPPHSSCEVSVAYICSFLRPVDAVLLLVPSSGSGAALTFNLQTHVSHITPKNTVKVKSRCYELKVIQVPITNPFNTDATFRVVLLESTFNPLEPEKKQDTLLQQASSKNNLDNVTPDRSCGEEMEENSSHPNEGEGSEFLTAVRSVCLKSGEAETLNIHFLPFSPGRKFCSVLLVCPQVGDVVYLVKATADLPPPSPLAVRPSPNILSSSETLAVVLIRCEVGRRCEEVLRVPRVNAAWERALAVCGQHAMSPEERRRRSLTRTLHSSTLRASTAALKLQTWLERVSLSEGIEYSVEASLPQHFTFPKTLRVPVEEGSSIRPEDPAVDGVDLPFWFQADSVGRFSCQVVLRSWCDTRVYLLEASVTSQGGSVHLDFSSPAQCPVIQDIPLHNESQQDWRLQAEVCAEGFHGPEVVTVPAGTRTLYPLGFHPAAQGISTGTLTLHNTCDGTQHLLTLRGLGQRPLPVEQLLLHCRVGTTTHAQLEVPNHSSRRLSLKVVTDLPVVSGPASLDINPGLTAPYPLAVSPWRRGKHTGCLSFVEIDDLQDTERVNTQGVYEVCFSLEIICEPPAATKVIPVRCVAQSSVAIEIPVTNPGVEALMLDVDLEGGGLGGARRISVQPGETRTYTTTFCPAEAGKTTGSVVFHSDLLEEFWYQLELYALPAAVNTHPQTSCQLGRWRWLNLPLVNPTAETLELVVENSNPTNYELELEAGSAVTMEPHSCTQLVVRFTPSSIGEKNHSAKITFKCPQLQDWCVLLSGRGLSPQVEEVLSVSCSVGSVASFSVPFINPTEQPAELSLSLTDADSTVCSAADRKVFSIDVKQTEGVQVSGGSSLDVPVLFAPDSLQLQQVWLHLALKPRDTCRSDPDRSTRCWTYPLCGIPLEDPDPSPVVQLEVRGPAGGRLQEELEVQLAGCWTADRQEVTAGDFLCRVRSDGEDERRCLLVSVETVMRNPETGVLELSIKMIYTPPRACRCSVVLQVQCVSGQMWEFPVTLVATETQADDVITTEVTEFGKTSVVGFYLTSTTRTAVAFTAAFLPGSSSEFSVSPESGTLPPAGSRGVLVHVSFTPSSSSSRSEGHSATLCIQASDLRWIYDVTGRTPQKTPPLCPTSTNHSPARLPPANQRTRRSVSQPPASDKTT